MTEDEIIVKRMCELARRAYDNNYYTYTGFLGLAEISLLNTARKRDERMRHIPVTMYGGMDDCERVIAAFGSEELFGYAPEFPVACVMVKPRMQKFADNLTHRDFLGSVMNLGIERDTIGDIYIQDNVGYIFCMDNMADYIVSSLDRVKHTPVECSITDERPDVKQGLVETTVQISSERIDAVIAKLYKMSRSQADNLFKARRIYVNGSLCENTSYTPKSGEVITARGFGRCEYRGVVKTTGKGNLIVAVAKW